MTSIGIVYDSGYGHTAAQARAVGEGAARIEGVSARLYFAGEVAEDPSLLDPCDALIFGTPTYMGSASATFKTFMEATSKIWLHQGWSGKLAAGFTNSGGHNGDKLNTLFQLNLFAMQHGMLWVGLGLLDGNDASYKSNSNLNRLGCYLGAMAQSNSDEGLEGMEPSDLLTASALGARVARASLAWNREGLAHQCEF
ncbi:flavodoxin family protein [Mycolicibacterium sp. P1-5]|uniref:flavodoxin family protein n=1 Tax=Mycolicibacterium sp. P1-5 TaxID=2024617 RepID=UPI0011EF6CFD|nr:flavodoxin family protein [Mycolicibacterium sp. P1-5]KAA0109828.1 flavodoxin family protein [Mycolicibacterium sp. P1-5]